MDGNSMMHHSSAELVIFTHLPNGEEVNEASQQSNLIEIQTPQSQQGNGITTEPIPNGQCNEFVGGLGKIVKGLEDVELYLCGKCNRTFKQKTRYERHIANHPSEKHYLCETCNKTFTRMSHLEKHIRTHTEERRHVCEVCGAAFILPHHLVRHNLIHSGDKPFQCEVCNKQFTRKAGLTQHKFLHTGIRPYECEFSGCGKHFTDRTTLRRHLLVHSREKPFTCKECDKTFRTKSACRKHYLRHFKGVDSFKCGVCEEMFKDEEQLKAHADTHEDKQSTGAFRCGFCLRVFKSQDDLDAHVPLHESGLIHACNHCSARFYTEEDLINHTGKHFGLTLDKNTASSENSLGINEEKSPSNIDSQTQLQHQNDHINDANKVLVVLQLPTSLSNLKDEQGTLQIQNIQQLLGTARVEKLVVTTDPISNTSQTLALELSEDQQESIQSILQTTTVIRNDDVMTPINDVTTGISDPSDSTFPDLTSHDTLGDEDLSNPIQSSFVLKSLPHQPTPPPDEKPVSQYLIVPPPNGGSFTPVDSKTSVFQQTSPLIATGSINTKTKTVKARSSSSLENTSVFKQPVVPSGQSHQLQLLVHEDSQDFQTPTEGIGKAEADTDASMTVDEVNENKTPNTSAQFFQHASYDESGLHTDLLSQSHDSDFIVTN